MTVPALPQRPIALAQVRGRNTLRELSGLLLKLADQASQLAEAEDIPSLADGLFNLRGFRREVTDLERHVESLLADLMTTDIVNLEDEFVLERRRGTNRKSWQSETILRTLFAQAAADENGEPVDPHTWLTGFYESVRACVPLTGSLAWRAGALREHHIDPDEYAETSPGRVSVKVSVRVEDDL